MIKILKAGLLGALVLLAGFVSAGETKQKVRHPDPVTKNQQDTNAAEILS